MDQNTALAKEIKTHSESFKIMAESLLKGPGIFEANIKQAEVIKDTQAEQP